MTPYFSAVLLGLAFLLGACIFSFLNVVIYRVPRQMDFIRGRSICPACGRTLKALDLIPLVSYAALRGTCRYCKAKIGIRDTLVELLGGCTALVCAWYFTDWAKAITVFAFFCALTVTSFIDWDTMEIPDGCWIAIAILAVLACFTMPEVSLLSRVIGIFCVALPMLLLTLLIPGAFGGGDIRLMAACGAFLGFKITLISTAFAVFLGGFYGIYLLASKKKGRKDQFAFGPFLCMGMAAGIFFGEKILTWYLNFLQF